jgi:hypothetical protein
MSTPDAPDATISQALAAFLNDQKTRIGPKTLSKYQGIISLYRSYLESYWPGHEGEYERVTKNGGTYCDTFGPDDATMGYGEFLGYFMPKKVICGKETRRAAGTVTRELARWLAENGYTPQARG